MKTLQRNNRALIKFEGRQGASTFEKSKRFPGGTTTKTYPLVIGSNKFIGAGIDFETGKKYKGFEEQLIGMEAGQSKIIQVVFPQNYHEKSLAGKPVFFKVDLVDFS
ncbi:FKBP-type peptidyl-prolyl cis-trans isomerase [Mycoplasma marinum]|uniref:peptidylprolyl isomerase n=1 Tax=Mycoplasma marinum TaxID=1937190 RepID=A0A4R0XSD7_9MOLU|nr:FKBP-type peptidyl-prolyl cis-trans isomerase [Mycoplasma marinum]TCG11340.1 hypothetical protein C4B24_02195 [Mycoplasma marinum]